MIMLLVVVVVCGDDDGVGSGGGGWWVGRVILFTPTSEKGWDGECPWSHGRQGVDQDQDQDQSQDQEPSVLTSL